MKNDDKYISHDLLISFLLGEANNSQINEVEKWLQLSEENKKTLDKLEKLWIETGKITPPPVAVDVEMAWGKLENRIDENDILKTVQLPKRRSGTLSTVYRVAAIFILLIGVYVIFKITTREPEQMILVSATDVIQEKLPDGSQIALNTNSKITYPEAFEKESREVELEGEAFFEVEHDPQNPFIVHTEYADVKVLGTSFNVKAYAGSGKIEVLVVSGKVELIRRIETKQDSSVYLEKGSTGIIEEESREIRKVDEIDPNALYWNSKKLIFIETRLSKVFELLENYYQVSIQVSNDSINNCLLSATFDNDEIGLILQIISDSFKLELREENNTFTLKGNGCQ